MKNGKHIWIDKFYVVIFFCESAPFVFIILVFV